jgi:hypothetical protein
MTLGHHAPPLDRLFLGRLEIVADRRQSFARVLCQAGLGGLVHVFGNSPDFWLNVATDIWQANALAARDGADRTSQAVKRKRRATLCAADLRPSRRG